MRLDRGRWTPEDAIAQHAKHKTILLDHLLTPMNEYFSADRGPTVVITHHGSLAQCADAYRDFAPWWASGFYTSDVLPQIPMAMRPDVWIFGHVHSPLDEQYGRTCVPSNPVEGKGFNLRLIISV